MWRDDAAAVWINAKLSKCLSERPHKFNLSEQLRLLKPRRNNVQPHGVPYCDVIGQLRLLGVA